MVRSKGAEMGRVVAEIKLTNLRDRYLADAGHLPEESVRTATVKGIVDTGAAMLVLPESIARQLRVRKVDEATVRYADHRKATREIVGDVDLEMLGRRYTFNAIVEPGRTDALIGAIVLEALDMLVDCRTLTLYPRDPNRIIAEIE
jgi:predicted aspartyl protease